MVYRLPGLKSGGSAREPGGLRSVEQVYTALSIAVVGPWGLWAMHKSPVQCLNMHGMFSAYPHRVFDAAGLKAHQLIQAAFRA